MTNRKPVVLVSRKLPSVVEARLARDYEARLNPDDRTLSDEAVLEGAAGADALLVSAIDRVPGELIRRLPPSVRIIATFSVGFDHIDIKAATERGIVVTNTPDVLTDATADIAMLLLLGAARRGYEAQRMLRAGEWIGWRPTQLMGMGFAGRNLGIVGMGRIGMAVAKRARAFGLRIHYHSRQQLRPEQEDGAGYHRTLETLLPICHFLSLHCPATPATTGMINEHTIDMLPQGAVLVNTARGTLIDDAALITALRSGRLFAAGLDVFAGEPALDPAYRDPRELLPAAAHRQCHP